MTGRYVLRPAAPPDGAVVYVPGVGGRTAAVRGWSGPDGPPVSAAVWSHPADPGTLVGRGRALAAALRASGGRDVVLLGHSMGALIAFEAALHAPETVGRLVLLAQYPPHAMHRFGPEELEETSVLADLAASLPPELAQSAEFPSVMRDVWKTEYRMIEEYQASGVAEIPVTAVGAAQDASSRDPGILAQWQRHTTGPVAARVVPGRHDFVEALTAAEVGALLTEPRP